MGYKIYFLFVLFGFGVNVSGYSQNMAIVIKDDETKEVLIGADIVTENGIGYTTNEIGIFELNSPTFPIKLKITYIGYQDLVITFQTEKDILKELYLKPTQFALDLVTVTGTKYEQNISRSTVTVDILKPDLLRSVNANSSDDILNKVPGVQVLDGQANIRGGSGYSYGAGSRVMILIDDIPALQPDAGFPNWGDIPVENLSQIEILKGASSTLYGSAALNGIINYRSSYATSKPETRVSTSATVFLSPKDPDKKWWKDTLRYESNASFVHKQKFGKLDFIASGFYNRLRGYNQFTDENRGRVNLNLRYRFSDRLILGFNSIVNISTSNSFFLWSNPGSGVMKPLSGTVSDRKAKRFYFDPSLTYTDKYNNRHKLLLRSIIIDNTNNTNQSNNSFNNYGEYQFQKNFAKADLVLTSGIVGTWNRTNSQILGDTTYFSKSSAVYFNLDKKFGSKLTIAAGMRYEHVVHNSPINVFDPKGYKSDGQLISRLSANYQLAEYTFLRASWGQGYRFPTLTERFVTTTFGAFSIFSNPALNPEYGWSSELAIKQGFSLAGFKGFIDFSTFISEYQDMIEFTFVFEPTRIGFQPQNIGNTRISGYELGVVGQAKIFGLPINIFGGYTYINPIYKNYNTSEQVRNSVSEPQNILKYRSKHQFKMDCEAKFWKMKWGVSVQRVSHVINIDKAFESVPPISFDLFGIAQYRDINNHGYTLVDSRLGIDIGKCTVTALISNILNQEYTLRPALVEAPRNIALRLDWKIN
ncbi:MAG: TonB-dependent receptor [Saprospiraceae bacterium]|nr:TonB-dependent receptor [Saprospiraceae bacterium]